MIHNRTGIQKHEVFVVEVKYYCRTALSCPPFKPCSNTLNECMYVPFCVAENSYVASSLSEAALDFESSWEMGERINPGYLY